MLQTSALFAARANGADTDPINKTTHAQRAQRRVSRFDLIGFMVDRAPFYNLFARVSTLLIWGNGECQAPHSDDHADWGLPK